MSLLRRQIAGVGVAIMVAGCAEPPPPEPPPQPPPVPAVKPPPPPPPKCEALDEGCTADAGTAIPIPGSGFAFTPPSGWTYAKLAESTVAQNGDAGAVIVVTAFEPPSAANELKATRDALAESLAQGVGLVQKKPSKLGAANQQAEIAGLKMSLWEKPGASRGSDEGAILVFSAEAEGMHIFGLGYAPREDADGTAAILKALDSIRKMETGDASK
jgi:hypothetical protein